MAKPELGTKRVCPETGRKFYDLNKEPIVSPYTGKTYPRSFFETVSARAKAAAPEEAEEELPEVAEIPETVSLSDVEDDEEAGAKDDLPDLDDDDEAADVKADDDTFLEEEEDEDDVSGIIGGGRDDDDEV